MCEIEAKIKNLTQLDMCNQCYSINFIFFEQYKYLNCALISN